MLCRYRITVTREDGTTGVHQGLYADGCTAIIAALEFFPDARCVCVRRLP